MSFVVAYKLTAQDNDTYMFEEHTRSDLCSGCGYLKDFLRQNPEYRPKKQMRDLSVTYDGFYIASAKFRDSVERNFDDVRFDGFATTDYFNLMPTRIVEFDSERSGTRLIKKCDECGSFESVVGTGRPPYIKGAEPILDGIFRTDLCFASGNEKHPLIIVGVNTKAELENFGLRGLEFSEVRGSD